MEDHGDRLFEVNSIHSKTCPRDFFRVDGKSYFYDGQKGSRYNIQDKLGLIDYISGVKIMRVDKLLLNPEAIESLIRA